VTDKIETHEAKSRIPTIDDIKKLQIKPGEIVVVRVRRDAIADIPADMKERYLKKLSEHLKALLKELGLPNKCIVAVEGFDINSVNAIDLLAMLNPEEEKKEPA